MRRIRLLVLVAGVLTLAVVATCLYGVQRERQVGVVKTQDPEHQFRFSKITQGTNHTVYSGNFALARLKQALGQSSMRPIVRLFPRTLRAQCYSRSSSTNSTVLWIGWSRKHYSYTVTNGIPYPTKKMRATELSCFFCEPSGGSRAMPLFYAAENPFINELVEAWQMPPGVTNFTGCKIRLTRNGTVEDVGSMQLQ